MEDVASCPVSVELQNNIRLSIIQWMKIVRVKKVQRTWVLLPVLYLSGCRTWDKSPVMTLLLLSVPITPPKKHFLFLSWSFYFYGIFHAWSFLLETFSSFGFPIFLGGSFQFYQPLTYLSFLGFSLTPLLFLLCSIFPRWSHTNLQLPGISLSGILHSD